MIRITAERGNLMPLILVVSRMCVLRKEKEGAERSVLVSELILYPLLANAIIAIHDLDLHQNLTNERVVIATDVSSEKETGSSTTVVKRRERRTRI
jgi:hypothetical protein